MGAIIDSLIIALEGGDDLTLLHKSRESYNQLMLAKLQSHIASAECAGHSDIPLIASNLSEKHLLRLATAPETFSRLSDGECSPSAILSFLRYSLQAEFAITRSLPCKETLWTALGDVRIDPSIAGESRINYVAQCLGSSTVPIDVKSPYCQHLNALKEQYTEYPPTELCQLLESLSSAWHAIGATQRTRLEIIALFFRSVVFRYNPMYQGYGSSSSVSHFGRAVFRNTHLAGFVNVVEGLLHESVHAAINVIDLSESCYHGGPEIHTRTCTSPWTGNLLSPRTYFHAVLVWYSLKLFWSKALGTSWFDPADVSARYDMAVSGFRINKIADELMPHAHFFPHDSLELIASLAERAH